LYDLFLTTNRELGIFRLSLTIAWQVKLIFFFPDKASGYWGKTRQTKKEKSTKRIISESLGGLFWLRPTNSHSATL